KAYQIRATKAKSSLGEILHHAVVAPRPAGAEGKFFDTSRCGFRVVQNLRSKNDAQLAQQFFEGFRAVSQARKFDPISIDIMDDSIGGRDNYLFQGPEFVDLATQKLNNRVSVIHRARVDDHASLAY